MRHRAEFTLALFACLLLAGRAAAALEVKGEASYKPHTPIVLTASGASDKAQYLWDVSAPAKVREVGGSLHVWAPPGAYDVSLIAVDFEKKTLERARFSFTVEGAPQPPGPGPNPPPTPISGLKVLIVEDTAARPKLPAAQESLITGKPFRDFLDAKCAADPDTMTKKAWRIADKDTDLRSVAKFYQDAQAKARANPMPRIVIGSDAGVVYEGPLPANLAEAQALVGKYGKPLRKAG